MKILFDGVNFDSNSGPNAFGKKLAKQLSLRHSCVVKGQHDVCLSFITNHYISNAPKILRLDGIYFNSDQNWQLLNTPIQNSHKQSDAIIYQTQFNQRLGRLFLGEHKKEFVINNATDETAISLISPANSDSYNKSYWCCSASWRPHKRLEENIRYFFEHAPHNANFIIMGDIGYEHIPIKDDRIIYTGKLSWEKTISVYKMCTTFVHLAYFDHCPNVVLDAKASGCKIVVASSGGTKEIAGFGSKIIKDQIDDIEQPIQLYHPPRLDFSKYDYNHIQSDVVNMIVCAQKYENVFEDALYNRKNEK